MTVRFFGLLLFQKTVNFQPVNESIKPAITRSVGISQAKTMATILVKVKFNWSARFEPGLYQTRLATEKKVVRGNDIEHRRSILWHLYRTHSAINRSNE